MAPVVCKPVLPEQIHEGTLLDLLANHLVLSQTLPYLPASSILNVATTSHAFRTLIYSTTPFRRLDLTQVKSAHYDDESVYVRGDVQMWRQGQGLGSQTEDEVYSAPLRGVLSKLTQFNFLGQVHTLILDGLTVTSEMVHEILTNSAYNVRILSLRDCKHLNEQLLCRALRTACRRTRPAGTPKLKGLYFFGRQDVDKYALSSDPAGDAWYDRSGIMTKDKLAEEWGDTLQDCRDVMAFDAVLCQGPGHINSPVFGRGLVPEGAKQFAVATHTIGGCAGCGEAPEGWTVWGEQDPEDGGSGISKFPLLMPAPLFSSDIRVAMCPTGHSPRPSPFIGTRSQSSKAPARFIARCGACLQNRYCASCRRWWCETCYPGPMATAASVLDTKPKVRFDESGDCEECWSIPT